MFANIKSKEEYHFLSLSRKKLREEDEDAASWSQLQIGHSWVFCWRPEFEEERKVISTWVNITLP